MGPWPRGEGCLQRNHINSQQVPCPLSYRYFFTGPMHAAADVVPSCRDLPRCRFDCNAEATSLYMQATHLTSLTNTATMAGSVKSSVPTFQPLPQVFMGGMFAELERYKHSQNVLELDPALIFKASPPPTNRS